MPPELLLIFLLSSIVPIAATTAQQPIPAAFIIALEGSNNSTTLLAPIPTIHALDVPTDTNTDTNDNEDGDILLPATRTVTQTARVTQTLRPTDPEPIIIFPFHLSLTERCSLSPSSSLKRHRNTTALVTNGDWITRLVNLGPNTAATVNHRIPDYPRTLRIGPYDAQKHELRFSYKNGREWGCEWGDGEAWRTCGECRVSGWDGEREEEGGWECGGEEEGEGEEEEWTRTKEMECSFILGWKHQLHASPAKPPKAEC